jgi:PAS domain-containing protein
MNNVLVSLDYIYGFFQQTYPTLPAIANFNAFVNSHGKKFPSYLGSVSYLQRVIDVDRANFTALMRAKGGSYANFSIFYQDNVTNAVVPMPYAPEYYPCLMTATPTGKGIAIGNNVANTKVTYDTIVVINATQQSSVGAKKYFPTSKTYGLNILMPVLDSLKVLRGAILGSITTSDLLPDVLGPAVTASVQVTMYDLNDTDPTVGGPALFYSTNNYTTKAEVSANLGPVTASGVFTFADRAYGVTIAPTAKYISDRQNLNKYIGIIVSVIVCLILLAGCVAIFFINRLMKSLRSRRKIRERYENLKKDQEKTQGLLKGIVDKEVKIRQTINALPQFVATVSESGKVIHSNERFDQLFELSAEKLEKGVYLAQLFISLESDFFRDEKYLSDQCKDNVIVVEATKSSGFTLNVKMRVKQTQKEGTNGLADSLEKPLLAVSSEDTEAYVVIGEILDTPNQNELVCTGRAALR